MSSRNMSNVTFLLYQSSDCISGAWFLPLHYKLPPSFSCSRIDRRVWVWWCSPIIPALGRLRQEGHGFEASLGDKARPWGGGRWKVLNARAGKGEETSDQATPVIPAASMAELHSHVHVRSCPSTLRAFGEASSDHSLTLWVPGHHHHHLTLHLLHRSGEKLRLLTGTPRT